MSESKDGLADQRLGALMIRLGLAANKDVDDALGRVSLSRLPVGKVLLLQEKISFPLLRLAIDAQWLLKEELIAESQAFESVHIARRNNWSLSDVLISMGLDTSPEQSVRLGELLVEAGWLSTHERLKYLRLATATGLPMGRVLISLDKLGVGVIRHAISLQNSVRRKEINRDHAIELLRSISEQLECKDFRLGELLIAAKIARKQEIEVAVEMSQAQNRYTGELMIEMGWLEEPVLNRAIGIQTQLRKNHIDYDRAIELLRNPATTLDEPLDQQQKITLYDFLKLTGYFQKGRLEELVHKLASETKILNQLARATDGSVKAKIKSVIENSNSLNMALGHFYEKDQSLIQHGLRLVSQVNADQCTVDRGMIDFATFNPDFELE
jgi:hypothetical protein